MNNELKKLNSLFDGSDESAMNIAYDIAHKYSSCSYVELVKVLVQL